MVRKWPLWLLTAGVLAAAAVTNPSRDDLLASMGSRLVGRQGFWTGELPQQHRNFDMGVLVLSVTVIACSGPSTQLPNFSVLQPPKAPLWMLPCLTVHFITQLQYRLSPQFPATHYVNTCCRSSCSCTCTHTRCNITHRLPSMTEDVGPAGVAASTAAWLAGTQLRAWNCGIFTLAELKGLWFLGAAGRWVILPLGHLSPILNGAWRLAGQPLKAVMPHIPLGLQVGFTCSTTDSQG